MRFSSSIELIVSVDRVVRSETRHSFDQSRGCSTLIEYYIDENNTVYIPNSNKSYGVDLILLE